MFPHGCIFLFVSVVYKYLLELYLQIMYQLPLCRQFVRHFVNET
jgi:hypothetical protein